MKRRAFIFALGSAAALPLAARAQQSAMPVIGYVNSGTAGANVKNIAAFRAGLTEDGFVEGKNVAIEFRWAENQFDRLPALVTGLINRPAAVIVGNTLAALRAKAATATIPIVFTTGSDPVRDGLVTSLARPGGNVTGVVFIAGDLGSKRLELLRQFIPKARDNCYDRTPEHGGNRDGAKRDSGRGAKDGTVAHHSRCHQRRRYRGGICNARRARG